MKYVVALVLGLIIGAAILAVGVVYNPFTVDRVLSPLSVTEAQVIVLKFSRVPAESLVYTNNGDSVPSPYPEKVLQLWEAPIRKTSAMATVMRDARNQPAGIGIKISSLSESTHLLRGEAIVDSIWYVYAPQHGSMRKLPAFRAGSSLPGLEKRRKQLARNLDGQHDVRARSTRDSSSQRWVRPGQGTRPGRR
jgi:hypothetical protein